MRPVASQTFENPQSNHGGDRLPPASELDLAAGLGLVDDGREATASLSDGVAMRHVDNVHLDVHGRNAGPPNLSSDRYWGEADVSKALKSQEHTHEHLSLFDTRVRDVTHVANESILRDGPYVLALDVAVLGQPSLTLRHQHVRRDVLPFRRHGQDDLSLIHISEPTRQA